MSSRDESVRRTSSTEAGSNELTLMDHRIRSVDELRLHSNLLRLNLHSNEIARISGLTSLNNLTELDLSSNRIARIQGLEGLLSLRHLNLSSNRVVIVESLFPLKNLIRLNLSYNRIERLKGFQDLWGDEFHLAQIYLHGNQVDSFDEVSVNLRGLSKLQDLTLKENPIYHENLYRPTIFNRLKSLKSLDNLDREMSSVDVDPPLRQSDFSRPTNDEKTLPARLSPSAEIYPSIERALNKFNKNAPSNQSSIDVDEQETSQRDGQARTRHSEKTTGDSPSGKNSFEDVYRSTVNELNSEKDRRWRAEQKIDELNREIDRLNRKWQGESTNKSVLDQISKHFQGRLNDEKEKFEDLVKIVDDYKRQVNSCQQQIDSYRQAQETNIETIKQQESQLDRLQSENVRLRNELNEEKRRFEQDLGRRVDESQSLKQEIDQLRRQLDQCRQLYTDREIQLKNENDRSKVDGDHLKTMVNKQNENELLLCRTELKHKQDKYDQLVVQYKQLEDEFRDALKIEERRYEQIFNGNQLLKKENEILQENAAKIREKDESNRKMFDDLVHLVKEQKDKLKDKTKKNEDLVDQNKKLQGKLERTLHELKNIREQVLLFDKEKKEVESRYLAQQSILAALREEKQLWSQELAHQGASLAQDRGRMESTIEILQAEVNSSKKQIEKELDNNKIKQTIIESQLETIQKLKDGIIERDLTIKQVRQELIDLKKECQEQIEQEQDQYRELNDRYEKIVDKRDAIKQELIDVQQELSQTKAEYSSLSSKWKEKSELINELDNKIRRASDNYQNNERKLVEQNEKLAEKQKELEEKLRQRDDDFRRQLETIEHSHRQTLNSIRSQYQEKIDGSERRVQQVEDEMRIILTETNDKQKKFNEKMKHFSSLINELQQTNPNFQ